MWVAIKIRKSTDEGLKYAEQNPAELEARGVGGGGEREEKETEICIHCFSISRSI